MSPGKRIIQQRAREQLAVVVVNGTFPKGLACPLNHAAVDLAFYDDGIDLRAAVIHGQVTL